ncbi:ABC transporter ATP-binding protein [Lactobacillus sp. DCY120]|uniref:ABC-type quaternary amine transporter n=1 Tax=Bombilactobacillus apium TaxID=2675299 RepID=A0A850R5I0_9LACO|nr:ATP-binding cassette domain-containing protein [Bombilactobacillus apium]NVY95862.1 ABC transporter ATP-binding protein [Bombilactobacillus apium]
MTELVLRNLNMNYPGTPAVIKDLNLTVHQGELLSLLGPSGGGKTTTLRLIAGFLTPTSGQILLNGTDLKTVPVYQRQFGMVFQSYALFPHLTVFENVAFGLRQAHRPKSEIEAAVQAMLTSTGLTPLAARYPRELSGGQQQRVALARALVVKPQLLLMDEPLSNLDSKLRLEMRLEIRRLQQKFQLTTIMVTHDQTECFAISDRIAILNQGRVEQIGTPEVLYQQPQTKFVARFLGYANFINVLQQEDAYHYQVTGQKLTTQATGQKAQWLTIRPEAIRFGSGPNEIKGKIIDCTYLGGRYNYQIQTDLGTLQVIAEEQTYPLNTAVTINLPVTALLPLTD